MRANDFFHEDDPHYQTFMGYSMPKGWWSRYYEYPWAVSQAKPDTVVADMGCGYVYRPLKDFLASICKKVFAVDRDPRVLETAKHHDNIETIVDNLVDTSFSDNFFDTIFCISVLEEIGDLRKPGEPPTPEDSNDVLKEFYRIIKPGGLLIATFDVRYDFTKPEHNLYKGLDLSRFFWDVEMSGFRPVELPAFNKENVVMQPDLNLCVYHTVLEARK